MKNHVSKRGKKLFMWFGIASSDTPSRLTLDPRGADALLTAAMFLMPCQAAQRQPLLNFDSIFLLYFSFAFLITPLTSQFACFFYSVVPCKKTLFFLFRTPFRSFVTQGLLFGKIVICLEGITDSTQNEI